MDGGHYKYNGKHKVFHNFQWVSFSRFSIDWICCIFAKKCKQYHIKVLTVFVLLLFIIVKQFVILIWQMLWWIATRNKKENRENREHVPGEPTQKKQDCDHYFGTKCESLLKILKQSKSDIQFPFYDQMCSGCEWKSNSNWSTLKGGANSPFSLKLSSLGP